MGNTCKSQSSLNFVNNAKREQYVEGLGMPSGMQQSMLQATAHFPRRYWIIDNSGSMATGDGHQFVQSGRREGMVACTRWKELVQTLDWIGEAAIGMEAWTEFRLINAPQQLASLQTLALGRGCSDSNKAEQRQKLKALCATSPTGRTPLCAHIRAVVDSVRHQAAELRRNGQRAVVTIATDGCSTDGDVAAALKPLEELPVWVIIKLCTDDDDVVDYWNNIDSELELDMDVLDDLTGEAQEVNQVNPWLTYGLPLHRLREWGSPLKLLDMLDEVHFTPDQAQEMMSLLLGKSVVMDLPPPALDMPGFIAAVQNQQEQDSRCKTWDPLTQSKEFWFSPARLVTGADGGTESDPAQQQMLPLATAVPITMMAKMTAASAPALKCTAPTAP